MRQWDAGKKQGGTLQGGFLDFFRYWDPPPKIFLDVEHKTDCRVLLPIIARNAHLWYNKTS
ncbi:MAG TPA: hypothetical protein DCZ76_06230 [Treponema sp.]|nr:hypothetical protein [Treponema sp.]